jgi:hypothetical protein
MCLPAFRNPTTKTRPQDLPSTSLGQTRLENRDLETGGERHEDQFHNLCKRAVHCRRALKRCPCHDENRSAFREVKRLSAVYLQHCNGETRKRGPSRRLRRSPCRGSGKWGMFQSRGRAPGQYRAGTGLGHQQRCGAMNGEPPMNPRFQSRSAMKVEGEG